MQDDDDDDDFTRAIHKSASCMYAHARAHIHGHAHERIVQTDPRILVHTRTNSESKPIKSNRTRRKHICMYIYIYIDIYFEVKNAQAVDRGHHRSVLCLIRIWSVWENTSRFGGIGRDRFLEQRIDANRTKGCDHSPAFLHFFSISSSLWSAWGRDQCTTLNKRNVWSIIYCCTIRSKEKLTHCKTVTVHWDTVQWSICSLCEQLGGDRCMQVICPLYCPPTQPVI